MQDIDMFILATWFPGEPFSHMVQIQLEWNNDF